MKQSKLLKDLNQEQIKAVTHRKGPLLIIAGAGTGKTTVITHRLAWLIEQKLAKPNEILALTFTEKAAAEMEERVDVLVPYGYIDTWISTFHAFGQRILEIHALDLGLPTNFQVLTKPEQAIFLKERLFSLDLKHFRPLGNPTKHIEGLVSLFSRCKDEDLAPNQYIDWAKSKIKNQKSKLDKEELIEREKQLELAKAYEKYQELMQQDAKLDFGDLITLTLKLFRQQPKTLQKYQQQFKYILVDEYQDTNYAQNELVKLLAAKEKNITVVGDDDQSIYKFRGAAIANILEFAKNFPQCKKVILTKNYRSPQTILNSAYKLIQHNNPDRLEVKDKIKKKLQSAKKGPEPQIIHSENYHSETQKVVEIIKERVERKKASWRDFAILARANDHLEPFIQELNRFGIPYKFSGNRSLYEEPEIRLLINLTKVLTQPMDNLALFFLASSEIYNLNVWELTKLNSLVKRKNLPLLKVFESVVSGQNKTFNLSNSTILIIQKLLQELEKYNQSAKEKTAGQVLYQFLKDKNYFHRLLKKKSIQGELKIRHVSQFFQKIAQFEHYSNDKSIFTFAEDLDLLLEFGEDTSLAEKEPDYDAVNVLTIHAAKGLEFPVVFLANLVSDRFPSRERGESIDFPQQLIKETLPQGNYHLQEERRLFYVGMTRAQEELYFCFSDDYGGVRKKKTSQFVLEALEKPKIDSEKITFTELEKIEKFALPLQTKELKLKLDQFYAEGKLVLNPHKIDDYLTCPLKFKYLHILEIPILKYHPVIYGSAIHKAVQYYFAKKIRGQKVKLGEVIKVFENSWQSEGFVTREHEEERLRKGKETLTNFYQKQEKLNRLPSEIEKSFAFDLDGMVIRGRYDLIYQEPRTKNKEPIIEIADFKTGEVENQKKADTRLRESRQMAIYALAYQNIEKKLPDKITLYFIDADLTAEIRTSSRKIEKTKEEIKKVKEGIKKIDFTATPSYFNCHYCAYKSICPDKYKNA